jgi:hypothetical protein
MEPVAEPVGCIGQASEVVAVDGLGSRDLDADHGAIGVLQHHVHFNLVAVAGMESLQGRFGGQSSVWGQVLRIASRPASAMTSGPWMVLAYCG